jgi:hypothetical protein
MTNSLKISQLQKCCQKTATILVQIADTILLNGALPARNALLMTQFNGIINYEKS